MFDLARTDPEGERTKRAMRGGMAVATDQSGAGQGKTLFRPDDMDDALFGRDLVEQFDAEFGCVAAECGELVRTFRIGDRQARAIRIGTGGGRQIMVGHSKREIGAAHLTSGNPKTFECLGTRHLVNEVAIDIDQTGSIIATRNNVRVPDLFVEGAGCGHDAAHIRARGADGQIGCVSGSQRQLTLSLSQLPGLPYSADAGVILSVRNCDMLRIPAA